MAIALLTNYLAAYRMPLYQRLADRHGVEVLCYGRGERYVPAWFRDLDAQLAAARFPARRLEGPGQAFAIAKHYDTVIAPFAGGAFLPAAYLGARYRRKPFILWASVWAQPRSLSHALALPLTRDIYRQADAVIAYGEHVRRFVARTRGSDDRIFIAPQSVEPELFGRDVSDEEVESFRTRHGLEAAAPLAIYVGRLVPEKGVGVLLDAWPSIHARCGATLVLVGDGPLAEKARATPHAHFLGPLPRPELPVAYKASEVALLPSIPTARFREPWGLVCNEAMHQGRPVIATTAVGAVAGGLVRNGETGLVVAPAQPEALVRAVDRLLSDNALRARLGEAAKAAVKPYTYDAMVEAFDRALATAIRSPPTRP